MYVTRVSTPDAMVLRTCEISKSRKIGGAEHVITEKAIAQDLCIQTSLLASRRQQTSTDAYSKNILG